MLELFTREAEKSGASGGFTELKKYLYRVASSPIRNVSITIFSRKVLNSKSDIINLVKQLSGIATITKTK